MRAISKIFPVLWTYDNHKFVKGDICDGLLVEELLEIYQVDAVINFAAESHVDRSLVRPGTVYRN